MLSSSLKKYHLATYPGKNYLYRFLLPFFKKIREYELY